MSFRWKNCSYSHDLFLKLAFNIESVIEIIILLIYFYNIGYFLMILWLMNVLYVIFNRKEVVVRACTEFTSLNHKWHCVPAPPGPSLARRRLRGQQLERRGQSWAHQDHCCAAAPSTGGELHCITNWADIRPQETGHQCTTSTNMMHEVNKIILITINVHRVIENNGFVSCFKLLINYYWQC